MEGADSLIDALCHNVCITKLYVNGNNVAPESEATIKYLTETRNAVLIPAAALCAPSISSPHVASRPLPMPESSQFFQRRLSR
jgi:hypothetical protein